MRVQTVVYVLGVSLVIPCLLTPQASAAVSAPSLSQVVKDTYLAPYRQTSVSTLQTVTYGKHVSALSITSITDSNVEGTSLTERTRINASMDGSPWYELAYSEQGKMYINHGRGWMPGSKNPSRVNWPTAVRKMAGDWRLTSVRPISGGHQFTATDIHLTAFKILDGLIEQVLLRSNLRTYRYASLESWLQQHFRETTLIETELVNGSERMRTETTTLSIHLTPDQIRQFWTATTGSPSGDATKATASHTRITALDSNYRYICHFTYKAIQVAVPKELPQ